MELTKEYFDEQINNLNNRLDNVPTNETISVLRTDIVEIKTDIIALQDDMRSVKNGVSEIKQSVAELNQRDKEDSDAFAKTLVNHDERLQAVEEDIQNLKLKQA